MILKGKTEDTEYMDKKEYGSNYKHQDKYKSNTASSEGGNLSDKEHHDFQEGQSVELVICGQTDLGYNATINNSCEGLLYENEVFQTLRKGQHIEGFIKKVRDDGKIDLSLHKPGTEKIDVVAGKIMDELAAHSGFIAVNDKSAPEVIYRLFGASKKTYKKAIGALYKKRLILIESTGIRLSEKSSS